MKHKSKELETLLALACAKGFRVVKTERQIIKLFPPIGIQAPIRMIHPSDLAVKPTERFIRNVCGITI